MLLSDNHLLLPKEVLAANKVKSTQKLTLNAVANSVEINLWYVSRKDFIYLCVTGYAMSIVALKNTFLSTY